MSSHRIEIRFCTQCRWMLRSTWMAQEILSTFEDEIAEVALVPGRGGVFEILVDEKLVWSRTRDGGFPDIAVLKSRIRDRVAPGRPLGHVDARANRSKPDGDA